MDVYAVAAAGMQNAFKRLDSSAQRVVRWGASEGEDVDLAEETIEQVKAETELAANAAVVKTADKMMGSLLDIKV